MKTVQNSADSSPRTMVAGWRRNLPMKQFDSPLAAADVQGAVVEKGIEVMGKMVDKQLQIIDDAQQKAEDFLKKEVRSNICKKTPINILPYIAYTYGDIPPNRV